MKPEEPPAEHHEFMVDTLEAMERGDLSRAAISMPPGHAKSTYCSRLFVAWYIGRNPRNQYIQGGHSQDFVEKQFGKQVRDLILDPRFAQVFPEVAIDPRSSAVGQWQLAGADRITYVAKGAGQDIAGYRGNGGGVDDPFGSRKEAESPTIREAVANWFFSDFRTRFLPGSFIFVVATRWHPDDLIGRIEENNKEGKGIPYHIINLPAIIENEREMSLDPMGRGMGEALWANFYTTEILLDIKSTLPERDWYALYKGRPRMAEGNVVKLSWFHRYKKRPADVRSETGAILERRVRRVTVSVDTANKNTDRAKYSVATVWAETVDGKHHLLFVKRKKVEYNELIPFIEDTAREWNASAIIVEDKGNGTTYIQQRSGKAPAPVISIQPENDGSKEFRFDGVTTMFEAGDVLFPESAPWLGEYEEELLAFPNGTYNDQVDSTSQYLNWAKKRVSFGSKKLYGAGAQRPST